MPRVGVIGSLVWDVIHGRDQTRAPVEEWGGIAYALAGMDAALPDSWEIVPLIKVGRDLSERAAEFLRGIEHRAPGARFIEVDSPTNRVVLQYQSAERRSERMAGGVPGWTWPELGPMVRDLDAIYLNFISGFELCLGTATALRQGFAGPIYADFHSLFLGMQHDGLRMLRPLPDAPSWFRCFDIVQMNEDEMRELSPDPMALSAGVLEAGVSLLLVTLGSRGVIYVATPDFDRLSRAPRSAGGPARGGAIRTARIPSTPVPDADPTGCGDVFGAVCCARLLAGDPLDHALATAVRLAERNAGFRGASALRQRLCGHLVEAP